MTERASVCVHACPGIYRGDVDECPNCGGETQCWPLFDPETVDRGDLG